jgi:NAD(P)-dependent dehydrogenase (short-subunit alcohol dehydrogenase family)
LTANSTKALENLAQTIVFLVSDEADFLTGQIISVDGAKTAHS